MSCDDIAGLTPEQVCDRYTNVVWHYARKIRAPGLPLPDRAQSGYIGLLAAIPRFDPTRGVKFSTYAGYWIRKEILEAIYNTGSLIRLPIWQHKAGARPTRVASLSTPLRSDDDRTLYDLVLAPEPDESIADHHDAHRLLARVRDPRDRHCLWQHVALGMQLSRIAEPLGITPERVRQLVKQTISSLRAGKRPRSKRHCSGCMRMKSPSAFPGLQSLCRTCSRLPARSAAS